LKARLDWETVTLCGFLPWVSNLCPDRFAVAVAAQTDTGQSLVVAVPSNARGLGRGEDFQLFGLQASWTSSLQLNNVQLPHTWIISDDAQTFLPRIRPAFLLMQCGLGLGTARRSLKEITQSVDSYNKQALLDRLQKSSFTLVGLEAKVWLLSNLPAFDMAKMRQLFQVRIAVTRLAVELVHLELESKGGSAYLRPSGTARRLREVTFLPVLTPSLVQLEAELQRYMELEEAISAA